MERRALGVVAIILIGLMAVVATAGLDNLPPPLRKSVEAANGVLLSDRSAFEQDRNEVEAALKAEPGLFQKEAAPWHARLERDQSQLEEAANKLTSVQKLAKANRRTDEYDIERGLDQFNSLGKEVSTDASELKAEAQRWLDAKRSLPDRVKAMDTAYAGLEAADNDAALTPVHKAMADWPAKRSDLEARLNGLKDFKAQGEKIWQASAALRTRAASGDLADSDIETLLADADQLDAAAREARESIAATDALANQLYVSWDKLLLDTEGGRDPRERIRQVETRFPDATLAHGTTTSDEHWEPLEGRESDVKHDVGMVIEHKDAGHYDSEAEHSAQPPAYARIAPPGQSNSYGSWSDGTWHWLPEYLILSQLLRGPRVIVTAPDYEAYQYARRYGAPYNTNRYGTNYGTYRSNGGGGSYGGTYTPSYTPRGPTGGGGSYGPGYTERYSRPTPSAPEPSHGYAGSRYQNQGGFSGSRYQSRGSYQSRPSPAPSRSYARSRGGRR